MKTIYKFPLALSGLSVSLPAEAKLLCVQMQREQPFLWVELTPNGPLFERNFVIVGTGQVVPPNSNYIGTFQMDGGALVFHVYEVL